MPKCVSGNGIAKVCERQAHCRFYIGCTTTADVHAACSWDLLNIQQGARDKCSAHWQCTNVGLGGVMQQAVWCMRQPWVAAVVELIALQ